MKRPILSLSAAMVLAFIATAPCLAADSPWNGTWKLNQEKSKLTGETFTLSDLGGGKLHYSNGATMESDFACDGKDYTTMGDSTIACTMNSDSSEDMVWKTKGTVEAKGHRVLSPDGKTITTAITGTQPDGTAYTETRVHTRVSGGPGLMGKWKSVKSESSAPDVFVVKVTPPDVIHCEFVGSKQSADGKMDGNPIALVGPTVPAGMTISFKMDGPSKLVYKLKLGDKAMDEGEQTISADGKTITDTSWTTGKPDEKEIGVYEKQ